MHFSSSADDRYLQVFDFDIASPGRVPCDLELCDLDLAADTTAGLTLSCPASAARELGLEGGGRGRRNPGGCSPWGRGHGGSCPLCPSSFFSSFS